MALKKYLNPKNDKAFKRIFGTEKNKDILIHFLNDIFGRTTNPIEEVTIENTAQDPKIASERTSYIDVFCRDTAGNRFIVEMQVASEIGFLKRAQYYAARAYIEQRDQGINYNDLKEVIFLAITDFTLFPEKAAYLSHHAVLDQASYEQDLKDFSFSFLELPKFKKKKEELVSLTERWAFFFKHAQEMSEEDLKVVIGSEQIIAKAYREIDKFNWTKEELAAYEAADLQQIAAMNILHTARQEGIQQGMEKGKMEGIQSRNIEIARSMIDKRLEITLISEVTGLSQEEIQALISQGKKL